MIKKYFLFIFIYTAVHSQTVLLEQDVSKDTIPPTKGANRKNYTHSYIGYGFLIGKSDRDGMKTKFGSGEFIFGIRYKRKISNFYSLGFDVNYNSKFYKIEQSPLKHFPDSLWHAKERIALRSFGLILYNRFNFGKRGNSVGNFIDLGGYADWVFNPVYITYDKYTTGNSVSASSKKQIYYGLSYINPINYGLIVHLGFNKYVLYASYRLSDIFKPSYTYPGLPRIIVGLQISMHK